MPDPILITVALGWEEAAISRGALLSELHVSGAARLRHAQWGDVSLWILRTGVGPERAARATRWAIDIVRPRAVVSTGCAGALLAGIDTGDVIVADEIVAANGTARPTNRRWGERYRQAAASAGIRARGGRLFTSAEMLLGPDAKRAVAERTGAIAADMEAAAVADCGHSAGAEVGVARVILDPFDLAIPPELPAFTTGSGGPSLARLLTAIARRPRLAADLIPLGASVPRCRAALATLHRELRRGLPAEPPLPKPPRFGK
jgi:adenosylhomocysteine nucleosidase